MKIRFPRRRSKVCTSMKHGPEYSKGLAHEREDFHTVATITGASLDDATFCSPKEKSPKYKYAGAAEARVSDANGPDQPVADICAG